MALYCLPLLFDSPFLSNSSCGTPPGFSPSSSSPFQFSGYTHYNGLNTTYMLMTPKFWSLVYTSLSLSLAAESYIPIEYLKTTIMTKCLKLNISRTEILILLFKFAPLVVSHILTDVTPSFQSLSSKVLESSWLFSFFHVLHSIIRNFQKNLTTSHHLH